jgi:hypothetical protein
MNLDPEGAYELDPTYGGRFAAGDTIAIVLPEPGVVLATIGRLTPERMFVTTFGPALIRPDAAAVMAWRPEGWSSWVVDTVGLRDGTYAKLPPPPGMALAKDIDIVSLPRFKAVAKGGRRVLAEYDPETLFIRAMVDSDDSAEFRDAPSVVPQDPTTFEVALSLNVGVDTELPDSAMLDQINQSRFVLAILREQVTSGVDELVFDHTLSFRKAKDATTALAELQRPDVEAFLLPKSGLFGPTEVRARIRSKVAYPSVRKVVRELRRIAKASNGSYDGFGALAE